VSQGREYAPTTLDDPVLNGPYDPPSRYFEIAAKGPTGEILEGRRPSESFIPVVPVRKRGTATWWSCWRKPPARS